MFDGHCAYCGIVLPEKGWHADHVEPVYREWWKKGNKTTYELVDGKLVGVTVKQLPSVSFPERDCFENHFPSCAKCNIHKGPYLLETWRRVLEQSVEILRNNYSTFRAAERFNLVAVAETKVVFYFEAIKEARDAK